MIERRNGVRKGKGEKRAMTEEEEVFFYLLAEIGRLCKTLPTDHLRDRGRPAKTARGALVAPLTGRGRRTHTSVIHDLCVSLSSLLHLSLLSLSSSHALLGPLVSHLS